MPVNSPSRQELDRLIRDSLTAVRTALENAGEMKLLFDGVPDALLTGAGNGYEYTAAELANIRAAFTDADKLRLIATNQATQVATSDFYANAKKVWGVNLIRR